MSTPLFEENSPWYQCAMDVMETVTLKMPSSLRDAINGTAEAQIDGEGQFIREAIASKLRKLGYAVGDEMWRRPSRKGVGGRPKHFRYPETVDTAASLNDRPREKAPSSSAGTDIAAHARLVGARPAPRRPASRGPGRTAGGPTASAPAPAVPPPPGAAQ
jgi:hypothetical protein